MYNIGDIFYYDSDYINKVNFCNEKKLNIIEIGLDKEGRMRYQIASEPPISQEQVLSDLRFKRQKECFEIINRGVLWYNTLTEQQRLELDTWYKEWLDVTETMVIPTKPNWLED